VVETVKRAEDDLDAWVVRLYESRQIRNGAVRLRLGRPIRRAQRVNMVEQHGEALTPDGDSLVFPIAPYEILTFKLWLE
jgi:alpha-mannosidase